MYYFVQDLRGDVFGCSDFLLFFFFGRLCDCFTEGNYQLTLGYRTTPIDIEIVEQIDSLLLIDLSWRITSHFDKLF